MDLSKLNDPSVLAGFTEVVEKTVYVSGKMWRERFEAGNPIKIIGIFKQTYEKFDELGQKMRKHHVLVTPKGDVVINGYGDLDARMSSIKAGHCILVEFVGHGQSPKKGFSAPLQFNVVRNPQLNLSKEQTAEMLSDLQEQTKLIEAIKEDVKITTAQVQRQIASRNDDFPF